MTKPDDRFAAMLGGPVAPMLAKLSAPNVATAFSLTAIWIADAWYIGRLGALPLASIALVFPVQAMMQMMSAGAMGGAVSSAVARALGAGDAARADALVRHGIVIAIVMAFIYFAAFGLFAGPVFAGLGGRGAVLDGAVDYAVILFAGGIFMWLANLFAAAIRATGDMATPARWIGVGALLHVGLSGGLTLGWGPLPRLGTVGPAVSVTAIYGLIALMLALNLARGGRGAQLRTGWSLSADLFRDILKVGLPACGNTVMTIGTVLIVTRLAAEFGVGALAGYGLGSRLELLIVPLSAGVGMALTATTGANFGARQIGRARRIAWTGGLIVGGAVGAVGLAAALWPSLWLDRFTSDAAIVAFGAQYLRIAAPFYGLFGLGMALYFASQGTGSMALPVTAGAIRLIVAGGGGAVAVLWFGGGPAALFACVAAGQFCFGAGVAASLFGRVWNPPAAADAQCRGRHRPAASGPRLPLRPAFSPGGPRSAAAHPGTAKHGCVRSATGRRASPA